MKFRPARKVERLSNCLNHLSGEIEMAVKTRPRYTWTKRPRELYCSLAFASLFLLFRLGGRFVISEIPLFGMSEHHSDPRKITGGEQCLVGSFTGEVGSYNATEPHKGWLILNRNQDDRVKAKASLTARPTSLAWTKVGFIDPGWPSGRRTA